jgi:hypothetical protein
MDLKDDARVPAMNHRQFLHGLIYIHTWLHYIPFLLFLIIYSTTIMFINAYLVSNTFWPLTSPLVLTHVHHIYSRWQRFRVATQLWTKRSQLNVIKICMVIHLIKIAPCSDHYYIQKQWTTWAAYKMLLFDGHHRQTCNTWHTQYNLVNAKLCTLWVNATYFTFSISYNMFRPYDAIIMYTWFLNLLLYNNKWES